MLKKNLSICQKKNSFTAADKSVSLSSQNEAKTIKVGTVVKAGKRTAFILLTTMKYRLLPILCVPVNVVQLNKAEIFCHYAEDNGVTQMY